MLEEDGVGDFMYIFKYDISENIIWGNQQNVVDYDTFTKCNPHVPLEKGKYFELYEDKILLVDKDGNGNWGDLKEYKALQKAIENVPFPSKNYGVDTNFRHYMELEKVKLANKDLDKIAISFTADKDYNQVWHYREKTAKELAQEHRQKVLAKINMLESAITPRRLRESVLGIDKGWLKKRNTFIEKERRKL